MPASFSTSMMSVWTATNTTLAQGELIPVSGQPPNDGTGSPKTVETGYLADALPSVAETRAYRPSAVVNSMTDPSNNETTYAFADPAYPSALTTRTDPKPTTNGTAPVYTYSYDGDGNLIKSVDPKPDTLSFFYNADNELCIEYNGTLTSPSCSSPPSSAISYVYDADGRRKTMKDSTGTTTWNYNSANNVTSLQNGAGTTLTYGYNLDGQVLCWATR